MTSTPVPPIPPDLIDRRGTPTIITLWEKDGFVIVVTNEVEFEFSKPDSFKIRGQLEYGGGYWKRD